MTAIDLARKNTVELYGYMVKEWNRERQFTDLPSSRAVQAYIKGALDAYKITLRNMRYWKNKEEV